MYPVLWIALGVLLTCLAATLTLIGRLVCKERRTFLRQMEARVSGRGPKSTERIRVEDWVDPAVDSATFEKLWLSAASSMRVRPELMRLGDKIEDLIVASNWFWPGPGDDIAEFFLELATPERAIDLARDDYETVGDLIRAALRELRVT